MEQVDLIPPSLKYLQFGRFLRNGEDSLNIVMIFMNPFITLQLFRL